MQNQADNVKWLSSTDRNLERQSRKKTKNQSAEPEHDRKIREKKEKKVFKHRQPDGKKKRKKFLNTDNPMVH